MYRPSKVHPRGLEETLKTLEKTLLQGSGGNAGGNISKKERRVLREWERIYLRAAVLCQQIESDSDS